MCTCVRELIGGGRCPPNAALSRTHLAAHCRPPLCVSQAIQVVVLRLLSHLGYVWGKASCLLPGDRWGCWRKHRLPQLDPKKSLFLFTSILPFFLQLESGDGLSFVKAVFSSYTPCIGGLWKLAVAGTYYFSVFRGTTEIKQVLFQSPVKINNKNY